MTKLVTLAMVWQFILHWKEKIGLKWFGYYFGSDDANPAKTLVRKSASSPHAYWQCSPQQFF
jgi:hypothetical protein